MRKGFMKKRLLSFVLACSTVFAVSAFSMPVSAADINQGSEANDNAGSNEVQSFDEANQAAALQASHSVSFVSVLAPETISGVDEDIVIGLNDISDIYSAELNVISKSDSSFYKAGISNKTDTAFQFTVSTASMPDGQYSIKSLIINGNETIDFSQAGIDAGFAVGEPSEYSADETIDDSSEENNGDNSSECSNDTDISYFDGNGNLNTADSIEDAISKSQSQSETLNADGSVTRSSNYYSSNGQTIICLDPGHDSSHQGASRAGLNEYELNLKIAQYCKAELEKYNNVKVYMTRETSDCPNGGGANTDCLQHRVDYAKSVGADIIVSIHLNINNNTAISGAEVYYPNGNYNAAVSNSGGNVATMVVSDLADLGLVNRGAKTRDADASDNHYYPDGSIGDNYAIIRSAKYAGFPGIIVEHCFLSNDSDRNTFLTSDSGLQSLGTADATGIAKAFNLSTGNTSGVSDDYLSLNGMNWVLEDDDIIVGTKYDHASNHNVSFKWQAYNLDTKQWFLISDWWDQNCARWYPVKGNYWLYVQAKTDTGIVKDDIMCFQVDKNYSPYYVELNGMYVEFGDTDIVAGETYNEGEKADSSFRWLSYNLDTQEWKTVSNWWRGNCVRWRPTPGNYWLVVQAKTANGYETKDTLGFTVYKDYSKHYINYHGIFVTDNIIDYSIGADLETDDPDIKFKWQIYDIDKNSWFTLADFGHGNQFTSWDPSNGSYWIHFEAETSDGVSVEDTIGYVISARYSIMKDSATNIDQMVNYYNDHATYPSFYADSDAPTIRDFCTIYDEECKAEGVATEVAFSQAMMETGYLKFGGDVDISQYNFAGIGATGGGVKGYSFASVREGVRAQVQHLKAYASTDSLNQDTVDPRFSYVKRGSAPYVEWLGIKENPYGGGWATAERYGYNILKNYLYYLLNT